MTATTITPSAARVFRAAVRAESTKLRSVRSTVWTLLTVVGLAIGFGLLVSASQVNSWDTLSASERLRFDPTSFSLSGLFLAQMAIGVLGVLIVTSEYATGQIRATISATPQRLTVLAAKATTFAAVALGVGLAACFSAFAIGQAVFSSKGIGASLSDPAVLRAVVGGALYLAAVGVLGIGLGAIIRRTAGAIAALGGLLLVIPLIGTFLPSSWNEAVAKYLPAQAGTAIFSVVHDPRALAPWTGYGVLLAWTTIAMLAGAVILVRRDV